MTGSEAAGGSTGPGGALPRMPGIRDEWEQFRHAWQTNARLSPVEPYLL